MNSSAVYLSIYLCACCSGPHLTNPGTRFTCEASISTYSKLDGQKQTVETTLKNGKSGLFPGGGNARATIVFPDSNSPTTPIPISRQLSGTGVHTYAIRGRRKNMKQKSSHQRAAGLDAGGDSVLVEHIVKIVVQNVS